MNDNKSKPEKTFSRRDFLKTTGAVTGGIIGGSFLGGFVGNQVAIDTEDQPVGQQSSNEAIDGQTDTTQARMFFKRYSDFEVLSYVTERIFPANDDGPGAIRLGVPYFIDRQLAGEWGNNTREYMMGPFKQGEDTQGYQSALNRGDIFLQGIRKVNEVSNNDFSDDFFNLEVSDQNSILTSFENNEVELRGVNSNEFFNMMIQITIEGAYSDPVYGGNKDMAGWKMKEYPGPVMSYRDVIDESEFMTQEPISLADHLH